MERSRPQKISIPDTNTIPNLDSPRPRAVDRITISRYVLGSAISISSPDLIYDLSVDGVFHPCFPPTLVCKRGVIHDQGRLHDQLHTPPPPCSGLSTHHLLN